MRPAETPPCLRQQLCRTIQFFKADHIIILQSLITKLARSKGMQKLIIAGLGLAFLGIMISSLGKGWLFAAGVLFVATAVLGIIGIFKMRKSK